MCDRVINHPPAKGKTADRETQKVAGPVASGGGTRQMRPWSAHPSPDQLTCRQVSLTRPCLFYQRGNCLQGVALKPVVHVNEALLCSAMTASFLDQAGASRPAFRVGIFDAVVRAEQLHRLFVFAARLEQQTRAEERGAGAALGQGELLIHGHHVLPTVEDVGGAVERQRRKILRMQKAPVPQLDAVAPAPGQLREEPIQRFDKLAPPLELARREVRELEDQQANVRLKLPARAEERRLKQS